MIAVYSGTFAARVRSWLEGDVCDCVKQRPLSAISRSSPDSYGGQPSAQYLSRFRNDRKPMIGTDPWFAVDRSRSARSRREGPARRRGAHPPARRGRRQEPARTSAAYRVRAGIDSVWRLAVSRRRLGIGREAYSEFNFLVGAAGVVHAADVIRQQISSLCPERLQFGECRFGALEPGLFSSGHRRSFLRRGAVSMTEPPSESHSPVTGHRSVRYGSPRS